MKRHVFVIACAPRSGSTLMQRLLMSHPDLFMWGEGRYLIRPLLDFDKGYDQCKDKSRWSWEAARDNGLIKGWYPSMMPEVPSKQLVAGWLDQLMGSQPFGSWGCKFIMITPDEVKRLHSIFPDAGFIFLTRNFEEVSESFQSVKQRWDMKLTVNDIFLAYQRLVAFFRDPGFEALDIHYDELVSDPAAAANKIEGFLGMQSGSLNMEVFKHKVRHAGDSK